MILEETLDWNLHLNVLNLKLNKAIGHLCKIRHYVLKYFTIFHSHLIYPCQIWGQNINTLNKIQALQVKAIRVINFRANNYDVGELSKNDKILRISDYIKLLNCLFVRDILTNSSILPFQNYFIKSENLLQYTRHAKQNSVIMTQQNTDFYDIKLIQHQAATTWNKLQTETSHNVLQDLQSKTKDFITNKILSSC